MINPDDPQVMEPPGGLSTEAELAWRQMAHAGHSAGDKPLMGLAVGWLLLSKKLLDAATLDPTNMAAVNAAVTASSTFLKFSEKLGLATSDRKALGIAPPVTKKPAGRPIRGLDWHPAPGGAVTADDLRLPTGPPTGPHPRLNESTHTRIAAAMADERNRSQT